MSGTESHSDVVICGAGPAGLALACSLAGHGLRVALAERQPEAALAAPAFDGREIALTRRSVDMLRALGAWARIPAEEIAPLGEARVLNGASSRALRFLPVPGDGEPLGQMVPNHLIRRALFEAAAACPGIQLFASRAVNGLDTGPDSAALVLADGARLSGRLVVAADTRFSELRRHVGIPARMHDFGKTMLVCRMAHDAPHGSIATEWFGFGQTIAMLPLNGTAGSPHLSSLVLTLPAREMATLLALDDTAFGAEIARRYEYRLGGMRLASTRHPYPLVAVYADRFVAPRLALVGDAAVGMHPVTAHGFNFGMDGQHTLATLIGQAAAAGQDIGATPLLHRYAVRHRRATLPLFLATNATAQLYTDDRPPARLLRTAAIRAGARLAPLRRVVMGRLLQSAPARVLRSSP